MPNTKDIKDKPSPDEFLNERIKGIISRALNREAYIAIPYQHDMWNRGLDILQSDLMTLLQAEKKTDRLAELRWVLKMVDSHSKCEVKAGFCADDMICDIEHRIKEIESNG